MCQSERLSHSMELITFNRIVIKEQLDYVRSRIVESVRNGQYEQAASRMQEYERLLSLLDGVHRSIDAVKTP